MTRLRWSRKKGRGPDRSSGRRFFVPVALLAVVALAGCGFERQEGDDQPAGDVLGGDPAREIEEMLLASAEAWIGGDLDGFMDDYWRSEDLTFSSGTGVTRGWESVRTRYLETYWAPGAARDSLRFQDIEVMELGEAHALALGQYVLYQLQEQEVVTATGFFSLVLRKTDEGWRILHDHTSAAPEEEDPGMEGS